MTRIPRKQSADFRLGSTPARQIARGIDTRSVAGLGRTLLDYGMRWGAERAREAGARAQLEAFNRGEQDLVLRDSGFFGFFDEQFNGGSRYFFKKQKTLQIDGELGALLERFPDDPAALVEAAQPIRERIFENLDGSVSPDLDFYFNQKLELARQDAQEEGVAKERQSYQNEMLLDLDEAERRALAHVEQFGNLSQFHFDTRREAIQLAERAGIRKDVIRQRDQRFQDHVRHAEITHRFSKLPPEKLKSALAELASDQGELRDLPSTERLQVASGIEAALSHRLAEARLWKRRLLDSADDQIFTEKRGHRSNRTPLVQGQLLQCALEGDLECRDKLDALDSAVTQGTIFRRVALSINFDWQPRLDELDRKIASGNFTRSDIDEREVIIDAQLGKEKAKADGQLYEWYVQNGVAELRADWHNLTKAQQLDLIEVNEGLPPGSQNYLTSEEADDFVRRWKGGPEAQLQVMTEMAREIPEGRRDAAVQQISPRDPDLALNVHFFAQPEPRKHQIGLSIHQGRWLRVNDPEAKKGAKEFENQTRLFLGRTRFVDRSGHSLNAIAIAAANRFLALRRESVDFTSPEETDDELKAILQDVVEGEFWRAPNGDRVLPLFVGAKEADSENLWDRLSDDFLRQNNNGRLPVGLLPDGTTQEYDAERIREDGTPVLAAKNRFVLLMPADTTLTGEATTFLRDSEDRMLVLDLTKLSEFPLAVIPSSAIGPDINFAP